MMIVLLLPLSETRNPIKSAVSTSSAVTAFINPVRTQPVAAACGEPAARTGTSVANSRISVARNNQLQWGHIVLATRARTAECVTAAQQHISDLPTSAQMAAAVAAAAATTAAAAAEEVAGKLLGQCDGDIGG
jgi:hypothetical protein